MIPIRGTRRVLCDGISRRELLHIGGLSAFGLGLGDVLVAGPARATESLGRGFGKAKSCILVFKYGSPSQHETYDPKPNAPEKVRGEMGAISTNVPGVQLCEGLPELAKIMDRLTIVRSLTHPYPLHGTVYATTGTPNVDTTIEAQPRHKRQWPFIGSIVDYVERQRSDVAVPDMPRNIALPFVLGSRTEYPPLAGPYGAFLGSAYDPVVTDFRDEATVETPAVRQGKSFRNPYGGIDPGAKLHLGLRGDAAGVGAEELRLRHSLLKQFNEARIALERNERTSTFSQRQALAYSLLTSGKIHDALDFQREPDSIRERYGMNLFGQSALAARRLVEAGTKFVTVFWDAFGLNAGGWDTHWNHFPRMRDFLLPNFDQGFSALILDLEERGMLDETLVLCISEHGRTPILDNVTGGGRGHWSRVYSQVYAGGGLAPGKVIGASDKIGGDVVDNPISPKDILATAFYLLGIDPHTTVPDALGRPMPITGTGQLRPELLG